MIVHTRSAERLTNVDALLTRGASGVVGDLADPDQTRAVASQVNRLGPVDAVIHNALVRAERLVHLSSGMHQGGRADVAGLDWSATGSYSDSKLFVTALAVAVARLWPDVYSNAVDPGWVPTRMGGPGAPDDLRLGHLTQEWLATSDEPEARTSGGYWFHQRRRRPHPAALDPRFQDELLSSLAHFTGVSLT